MPRIKLTTKTYDTLEEEREKYDTYDEYLLMSRIIATDISERNHEKYPEDIYSTNSIYNQIAQLAEDGYILRGKIVDMAGGRFLKVNGRTISICSETDKKKKYLFLPE